MGVYYELDRLCRESWQLLHTVDVLLKRAKHRRKKASVSFCDCQSVKRSDMTVNQCLPYTWGFLFLFFPFLSSSFFSWTYLSWVPGEFWLCYLSALVSFQDVLSIWRIFSTDDMGVDGMACIIYRKGGDEMRWDKMRYDEMRYYVQEREGKGIGIGIGNKLIILIHYYIIQHCLP